MDESRIDDLIESAPFINQSHKDQCKKYFKQAHSVLGDWFYQNSIPKNVLQGDILDPLDLVYFKLDRNSQEIEVLENNASMLLSNSCDIASGGRRDGQYISVAPIINFNEYSEKAKPPEYKKKGWNDFLKDVRSNKITDILFLPSKPPLGDSVVFLDKISSISPDLLNSRLRGKTSRQILSLSQIGHYIFLIKLTYHFARYEDQSETERT